MKIQTADGYGQPENPHSQDYWVSHDTMEGYINPDWIAFDKANPKLEVYDQTGTRYMGVGGVEGGIVWQINWRNNWTECSKDAVDIFTTDEGVIEIFGKLNTREVYVITAPEKEAEASKPDAKHTPGPWMWKPDANLTGYYIETVDRSHNKTFIAEVGGGMQSMFEIGRNANLIAAAPELLEALEMITNQFRLHPNGLITQDMYNKAKAAIAKATGKGEGK